VRRCNPQQQRLEIITATANHKCTLTGNYVTIHVMNKLDKGYWHQRANERHGNPPQGNQELLVVKDKVGRSQVSLGQVHEM